MADLSCSFCGLGQHEVEKLIAGPGVYICNECVALCGDIVVEDREKVAAMDDSFDKMLREKAAEVKAAPEREPTVADLVANLRARCDAADPDAGVVVLETDLVLAIADGIEMAAQGPSLSDDYAPDEIATLAKQAAKEIVKLIVTRLFEPAKAEGEKALEAAKRLGMSEEKIAEIVVPPSTPGLSTMPPWAPWASIALGGAASLIAGAALGLFGRKRGLGV